jgi:hypothetical protein
MSGDGAAMVVIGQVVDNDHFAARYVDIMVFERIDYQDHLTLPVFSHFSSPHF